MNPGVGWPIAVLVALGVGRGHAARKQTGRSLPSVRTVLAGVVAVLLTGLFAGLLVIH